MFHHVTSKEFILSFFFITEGEQVFTMEMDGGGRWGFLSGMQRYREPYPGSETVKREI